MRSTTWGKPPPARSEPKPEHSVKVLKICSNQGQTNTLGQTLWVPIWTSPIITMASSTSKTSLANWLSGHRSLRDESIPLLKTRPHRYKAYKNLLKITWTLVWAQATHPNRLSCAVQQGEIVKFRCHQHLIPSIAFRITPKAIIFLTLRTDRTVCQGIRNRKRAPRLHHRQVKSQLTSRTKTWTRSLRGLTNRRCYCWITSKTRSSSTTLRRWTSTWASIQTRRISRQLSSRGRFLHQPRSKASH